MNIIQDMLLIEDPSIFRLYKELIDIAEYFILPIFTLALIIEYFNDMNFGQVIKKLIIVILFIGSFYSFHTEATKISLDSANSTLKRVSPTNLFIKKWTQKKLKTKSKASWDSFKEIIIPNFNDLVGTAFFVLAKIFIWLLKLIYSSVYHLTYIFAGVTAILYFLGWTKDALKGTIQASLWCMIMPFVIVAILALVGNSIESQAINGELIIAKIDSIIWLFGVTLLLLISPLITFGMIRGDGVHSFGSKMGSMVVSSGFKAMAFYPLISKMMAISRLNNINPFSRTLNNKLQDNKKSNYSSLKLQPSKSKEIKNSSNRVITPESGSNKKSEKTVERGSIVNKNVNNGALATNAQVTENSGKSISKQSSGLIRQTSGSEFIKRNPKNEINSKVKVKQNFDREITGFKKVESKISSKPTFYKNKAEKPKYLRGKNGRL
ncbi:MAG: hypothetical protein CME62_15005 [Halobacteriovoraceae bacterium]|nr:hypothetical protein [Halobacteriovoraceae bacterium]|tara:strand:- start:3995 stop:5302 length:1308 start_codon:yes stop_codon:yes gene_type:complete